MLIDKQTDTRIKKQLDTVAEPVMRVVLSGVYKEATEKIVREFGLDDAACAGVNMEILLFLTGLQKKQELREALYTHPSLTKEQGEEALTSLQKSLFAPLAQYLPNDEEGDGRAVALIASINDNTGATERMNKLPSGVQDVIKGEDLQKAFVTLVRKHSLSADVARTIAKHVSVVLVGLGTTNDFKVNVTKDTGLDPSKLEAVFQDVEISLFKPVRTAILTALEQKKAGTAPTATTVPANDPYKTEAS